MLAVSLSWLAADWADLWQVPVSAVAMLAVVIAAVRIVGLRSFSKMSSFDFAVTVSIGSILGGVATGASALINGALAASTLGVQAVVSWIRARRADVQSALDNTPMLLMDGREMLDENLRTARIARSDLVAKLREANVASLDDVRVVVLETTGDISVIHGANDVDPDLLEGLRNPRSR